MFGMVSGKWTIIVISTLQDIATSSQPINQNVLDVVAANEIETENDSNTVKFAKKRGRPPKSATQSSQPSTSTGLATAMALSQPTNSYNLRTRKN